jgi:hypothetical protein
VTPADLAERLQRLEAASVDQQLQIKNLRTMLEMTCNELADLKVSRNGLRQRDAREHVASMREKGWVY